MEKSVGQCIQVYYVVWYHSWHWENYVVHWHNAITTFAPNSPRVSFSNLQTPKIQGCLKNLHMEYAYKDMLIPITPMLYKKL